jgi:hypothetical protein
MAWWQTPHLCRLISHQTNADFLLGISHCQPCSMTQAGIDIYAEQKFHDIHIFITTSHDIRILSP